jgi:ribulose-phosphate 3-epimerase
MRELADNIQRRGLPTEIAVDGGIAPDTAARVTEAGASVLIAGGAIFGKPDFGEI